jgi:hypothetical protein
MSPIPAFVNDADELCASLVFPSHTYTSISNCSFGTDIMVFTANQGWYSRIYVLQRDGSVITYFQYDYYIFNDVAVVNNEVYVTDWIAPRLYKVNLFTGALDLIVDDWSLLSMYDVAFDGTFFYIDEWSLNRYDIYGSFDSAIPFNEQVKGSAWDGVYYYTLTEGSIIKCWDISDWPQVIEIQDNSINPPSNYCRGLWFDGEYFWTAEHIEDALGYIYQFDDNGTVVNQWLEPAFMGYAACIVSIENSAPIAPETPSGPYSGVPGEEYTYSTSTIDPDGNQVYYIWDWGDGASTNWLGPYDSGVTTQASHVWNEEGRYELRVKAKDIYGEESDWSEPFEVLIENHPPESPTITGPSQGQVGVEYNYTFVSTDIDNDTIRYLIDWGDDTSTETKFYNSGAPAIKAHSWRKKGTYIIKAKAIDENDGESDWATLEIRMPLTIVFKNLMLARTSYSN